MSIKTIHIFGYGETQVIGENTNKKVLSTPLTKLQAVVDEIFSKKPNGNNATALYHAINIFKGNFADFIPKTKGEKSFRVKYSDINSILVDELVAEVEVLP